MTLKFLSKISIDSSYICAVGLHVLYFLVYLIKLFNKDVCNTNLTSQQNKVFFLFTNLFVLLASQVLDGFNQHFLAIVLFPLSSPIGKPQQHPLKIFENAWSQ